MTFGGTLAAARKPSPVEPGQSWDLVLRVFKISWLRLGISDSSVVSLLLAFCCLVLLSSHAYTPDILGSDASNILQIFQQLWQKQLTSGSKTFSRSPPGSCPEAPGPVCRAQRPTTKPKEKARGKCPKKSISVQIVEMDPVRCDSAHAPSTQQQSDKHHHRRRCHHQKNIVNDDDSSINT